MKTAIIIQGQTGTGKSDLAYEIAKFLKTDVISADSRQIYKFADIGTNKTRFNDVLTHLIDIKNPDEEYSAFNFLEDTKNIIKKLEADNKIPVIVGGTAFYIDILTGKQKLYKSSEEFDSLLSLNKEKYKDTPSYQLSNILQEIAPLEFEKLNDSEKGNTHRLIRRITETEYSKKHEVKNELVEPLMGYNFLKIGIKVPKQELDKKIEQRVDKMLSEGLHDEVQNIIEKFGKDSMILSTIGYKEFLDENGSFTIKNVDEVKEKISSNTKKYAKRQLTWLKRDQKILWYEKRDDLSDKVISEVINLNC